MILEEETFAEYGYYPKDLKSQSGKKILVACDDCGKIRVLRKCDYHSLCMSCRQKGERNPMFGRTGEKSPIFGKTGENCPNWKGGLVKRICEACSKEFEVTPSEIRKGHGKFCSTKCHGEWLSKHQRGERNHTWKGGISFEPYCEKFDEPFKEYIRDKFGRICFLCQKTEEENGRRLSVHHVNYDKDCLCNDNLTCQFVPLCISCNNKANSNRKMWEAKINDMLHNSLKGWYI